MISQTFVKLLIFFLKGAPGATTWLLLSQSLRMSWPLRRQAGCNWDSCAEPAQAPPGADYELLAVLTLVILGVARLGLSEGTASTSTRAA